MSQTRLALGAIQVRRVPVQPRPPILPPRPHAAPGAPPIALPPPSSSRRGGRGDLEEGSELGTLVDQFGLGHDGLDVGFELHLAPLQVLLRQRPDPHLPTRASTPRGHSLCGMRRPLGQALRRAAALLWDASFREGTAAKRQRPSVTLEGRAGSLTPLSLPKLRASARSTSSNSLYLQGQQDLDACRRKRKNESHGDGHEVGSWRKRKNESHGDGHEVGSWRGENRGERNGLRLECGGWQVGGCKVEGGWSLSLSSSTPSPHLPVPLLHDTGRCFLGPAPSYSPLSSPPSPPFPPFPASSASLCASLSPSPSPL
eukprot:3760597-Rhodomonas_salina.1